MSKDLSVGAATFRRRVWFGAIFGFAVVIALALFGDARTLAKHLGSFATFALVPALGLVTVSYFIRVIKWEVYLVRLGIRLPVVESWLTFFGGMVMSISPGKVGEVLKSFILRARHGLEVHRTAPVVVAERLTDLVAVIVLAAWGVANREAGVWVVGLSAAVVVIGLGVLAHPATGKAAAAVARRGGRLSRWADAIAHGLESMRQLLAPRTLVSTTALSVGAWVLECIATWLILSAFPNVQLDLATATFIFAFSTLAGAVSMLPGGLGLTEGSMIALLTTGFDVMPTIEMATAATLVVRFCTLWYGVVLGAISLWWLHRRPLGARSEAIATTEENAS